MSTRSKIMDSVVRALDSVPHLRYVSEKFQTYDEVPAKHLPCAFPIDTNEELEPYTIGDAALIHGKLTILITCYVFSETGDVRQQRTELIQEITRYLLTDTLLGSLILDIEPRSIQTDQGMIENYSLFNMEFEIDYVYTRTDGG